MKDNFDMLATTLYNLEEVLAKELRQLGAQDIKKGVRNVSFKGDLGFLYKANVSLRTAIRILVPIRRVRIRDERDLYNKLMQIRWEKYMEVDQTFHIQSVLHQTKVSSNSHYVTLKAKDAIVDYFRNRYDERPNVDSKYPHLSIHIHINRDLLTISLDSSGSSLHHRGYRDSTNLAPINEVLAAGMLMLSGYDGSQPFLDPMCGSGTILIEAAMIAAQIPANINRKHFAFENWKNFDEDLFEKIHESLLKKVRDPLHEIIGFDKAPSAVHKAKMNLRNAHLAEFVKIEKQNFFKSEKPWEEHALLMFNPPYGERLEIEYIEEFYKDIGDKLKQSYPDSSAWLITSDMDALKNLGLKTSKRIALRNGALDCKFVKYDLYSGSKKGKYLNA